MARWLPTTITNLDNTLQLIKFPTNKSQTQRPHDQMLHLVRLDAGLLGNVLESHAAALFLGPPEHGFDEGHEVKFLTEEGDRGGEDFLWERVW